MTAAFELTPAERRVPVGLLAGRTLADTATALGVAATSVKSQLEKVFSKTGVSRQADLILLKKPAPDASALRKLVEPRRGAAERKGRRIERMVPAYEAAPG